MTKGQFEVKTLENGMRLTGVTLRKPVYPTTKRKTALRLGSEIHKLTKCADNYVVTVTIPNHTEE